MAGTSNSKKTSEICEDAQRLLNLINDLEYRLQKARKAYKILYSDYTLQNVNHDGYVVQKNPKRKRAGRKQKLRDTIYWKGQYLKAVQDKQYETKCYVFK